MSALTEELLHKFIKIAGNKLSGDWIVIGGTVLPLIGINHRITVDIDFIGKTELQQMQNIELMDIAIELGLPVENINQAGAYFLSKIINFEDHLILIHKGSSASVFRPDLYLYLKLKLGRFTETDYSDCMHYIKYSKKNSEIENLTKSCEQLLLEFIDTKRAEEQKDLAKKLLAALH